MPCCGFSLTSRYKRKIRAVYPKPAEEAVFNKRALEQLEFYALSQRQLLPKIGKHVFQRTARDVSRRRAQQVACGVHIFHMLLKSCHSELKLFVVPLFRAIRELLESGQHAYQRLGVTLFCSYAAIEEETPTYHGQDDFLVQILSSMCWKHDKEPEDEARISGLEGLKALFSKAADKRNEHLWEPKFMDLIVPVFLHNIDDQTPGSPDESQAAAVGAGANRLATENLQQLISLASLGTLMSVLRPLFSFMDKFECWSRPTLRQGIFSMVLQAVQKQYVHVAVGGLLQHMDHSTRLGVLAKTGIVKVLALSVTVAEDAALGPAVIEVFHSLLKHLRISAEHPVSGPGDTVPPAQADEERFQEVVLETVGSFAEHLTTNQKVEIMIFIIGKIPTTTVPHAKACLLRCLIHVARVFEVPSLAEALPEALLAPLLRASVAAEPVLRRQAQEALQLLLSCPRDAASGDESPVPQISTRNRNFIRKKAEKLHWHLFAAANASPSQVHSLIALSTTFVKLGSECGPEETLDIARILLAVQVGESGVPSLLSTAMVASVLLRIADVHGCKQLRAHVEGLVQGSRAVHQKLVEFAPSCAPPLAAASEEAPADALEAPLFSADGLASAMVMMLHGVQGFEKRLAQPYRQAGGCTRADPALAHGCAWPRRWNRAH